MRIDLVVNSFMESIEVPFIVSFFKILALITEPLVLAIFSLVIATYFYFWSSKRKAIVFGGVAIITSLIIKILKEIFQRARPLNSLIAETSQSFPSGHATFAVVFFGLLTYFFVTKKYKFATIFTSTFIILLIGFSRIYLRVHWLTDVLGGFVWGSVILILGIYSYKKIKLN
jgi:undecaprenyl-diphosphatase